MGSSRSAGNTGFVVPAMAPPSISWRNAADPMTTAISRLLFSSFHGMRFARWCVHTVSASLMTEHALQHCLTVNSSNSMAPFGPRARLTASQTRPVAHPEFRVLMPTSAAVATCMVGTMALSTSILMYAISSRMMRSRAPVPRSV